MEENLIDRIGDEYLNPNFQDGQILLNSDINEIVSIVKEGINANFNDIQKIQNGELQVGNSNQLDGATLAKFSDGELEGADNKVPTSQVVKSYVDNKVQEVKDTTEVGQLVEDLNQLGIEVGNKVDKEDLVSEETSGNDKAYNCDYINELFESGVGDSLPIGTIVEYDGNNIPDGFEEVVEPQDATVYVGPTEPTDGQDVWIQKSVNLLNKNAPLIVHAYPDGNNKSWIFDNNGHSFVIEIESNSEYVITKPSGANIFNISTSISMPTSGGSATNLVDGTNNEIHIRSGANDKYLIGYFAWSGEAIDVASLLNDVQVQKGSIATPYEPYVDKKIYVKNDNGVYEEFYKEAKTTILFEGATQGDVPLSDTVSNYDYIEVLGSTGGGEAFSAKVLKNSNMLTCLVPGIDIGTDNMGIIFNCKVYIIENNLLRLKQGGRLYKYETGDLVVDRVDHIFVKKVIGYKTTD